MKNSRRSLTVAVRKALVEYEMEAFQAERTAELERLELAALWQEQAERASELSPDVKECEPKEK